MTAAVFVEDMVSFGTNEFLVQQHSPKPSLNKVVKVSCLLVE